MMLKRFVSFFWAQQVNGRIALSTKTLEPEPGDMIKNPQKVYDMAEVIQSRGNKHGRLKCVHSTKACSVDPYCERRACVGCYDASQRLLSVVRHGPIGRVCFLVQSNIILVVPSTTTVFSARQISGIQLLRCLMLAGCEDVRIIVIFFLQK